MSNQYLNNHEFEATIRRYQKSGRDRSKYELMLEDLNGVADRVKGRKCVSSAAALASVKASYDKVLKEHRECEKELAVQFYNLAESIVRWRKFSLIEPEDAVQEGVVACFEKIVRFDSSKGSAFNYLTTCILNQLRQMWRGTRNYNEFKIKYQDYVCSGFEEFVARNLREKLKNYRLANAENNP